jgi:hypothetical protein
MSEELQNQLNEIVDAVDKVVVEGASKEEGAGALKQGGPDDMPSAEATSSSQKVIYFSCDFLFILFLPLLLLHLLGWIRSQTNV